MTDLSRYRTGIQTTTNNEYGIGKSNATRPPSTYVTVIGYISSGVRK